MSAPLQNAIIWPTKYLPGTTDNFVTNEVIILGGDSSPPISAQTIWSHLTNISQWTTYYHNAASITPPTTSSGTHLTRRGETFSFSTFGFPVLPARVEECVPPAEGQAGRLAWSAKLEGDADGAVDVYHAWLIEDLEGGRVRILTQESQIGKPAAELAGKKPNRMLLGHQDW
jgi:hypothetical protein